MWVCIKFMYKVPEWTAPNQTTPNWIMQSQTKACITKSCDVCAQVRYYALYTGKSTLMFWDNLSVQASRVKKSKRESTAGPKLKDTIFFSGPLTAILFPNCAKCFSRKLRFHFQANMHLIWWTPYIKFFSITGHHRNSNLSRQVPKYRSSLKIAIEK